MQESYWFSLISANTSFRAQSCLAVLRSRNSRKAICGPEGDAADAKGKGKGKARAPPGAPKLTRKERKKASIARAKGFTPKVAEETPKKPVVAPLGQVKLKKGKKRLRPGQSKREGGAAKPAPKEEEATKKKRVRLRNRSGKTEDKVSEPQPPKCKKGHSMGHRSDNPSTYKNQACCDVCGKENLPKLCSKGKLSHFFHCSFCRFDMCPNCSESQLSGVKGKDGKEAKVSKKKDKKKDKKVPEPVDIIPRARRELWIPTEAEAVNRAPINDIKTAVLYDWVEGKPVFSMLAFKNDIQFWRQNESMKGLSARSMMVSFVMQLITAVYLLNSRETSRLLLFEIVLDTGLAFWKLRKAIKIQVVKEFPFISFGGQKGYEEAGTDKYDEEALRYMYAIAVPLFIGFTIRSSLYEKESRSGLKHTAINSELDQKTISPMTQISLRKSVPRLPCHDMGSQPSPGLDPGTPPSPNGAEEVEVQAPEAARWAWAAAPRRPRARRPRPRRSFTPSTGTPDTESRPTSSSFGGTWPDLADEEEDAFADDPDPLPEAAAVDRLSEVTSNTLQIDSIWWTFRNIGSAAHSATFVWPGREAEVLFLDRKMGVKSQVMKKPSKVTKSITKTKTQASGSQSSKARQEAGSSTVVNINRAPVLTLWITVCMRQLGHKEELALTAAKVHGDMVQNGSQSSAEGSQLRHPGRVATEFAVSDDVFAVGPHAMSL
eukprot:s128_g13.t1